MQCQMLLRGDFLMLLFWWEYYRIFFYDFCGNIDGLWLLLSPLQEVLVLGGTKNHLAVLVLAQFGESI